MVCQHFISAQVGGGLAFKSLLILLLYMYGCLNLLVQDGVAGEGGSGELDMDCWPIS